MQFSEIVRAYRLGMLLSPPTPVLGGLMHTTYRMDTAEGSYAVKVLNPSVMARQEALGNMIASERIAAALSAFVPAVHALTVGGEPVVKIGGAYVMLYPWISAKPLFPPALTVRHAAAAGDVLGRIHVADVHVDGALPEPEGSRTDWAGLARLAENSPGNENWAGDLGAMLGRLGDLEARAAEAETKLGSRFVQSHRDFDPKNVLWTGDRPSVIDWEAAGPVRPETELCAALLAWSDDGAGGSDRALGKAFLEAYRAKCPGGGSADWETAFDAGAREPLDWLAFNIRRACGVEAENEGARRLGEAEAQRTLHILRQRPEARAFLRGLFEDGDS